MKCLIHGLVCKRDVPTGLDWPVWFVPAADHLLVHPLPKELPNLLLADQTMLSVFLFPSQLRSASEERSHSTEIAFKGGYEWAEGKVKRRVGFAVSALNERLTLLVESGRK